MKIHSIYLAIIFTSLEASRLFSIPKPQLKNANRYLNPRAPLTLKSNYPLPPIITPKNKLWDLEDSTETGATSVSAKSVEDDVKSAVDDEESVEEIPLVVNVKSIDLSPKAVVNRLKIYIYGLDAGALFSELDANPAAASLSIFEELMPDLIEFLLSSPGDGIFHGSEKTPTNLVACVVVAFIHFGVDVTRAKQFKEAQVMSLFVGKFISDSKPILAFFILLQDYNTIEEFAGHGNLNFFAVHRAIILLPRAYLIIRTVDLLYTLFGAGCLDKHKIPLRLFRDTTDDEVCRFLCQKGFDLLKHRQLYLKCRLARNHPKWEVFSEIFGRVVIEDFLESGLYILPQQTQKSNQPILPCHLHPVKDSNNQRRELYVKAYGKDSI